MKLDDHIALWNHASVKVMDFRYAMLEAGEMLSPYRLPANAFLYVIDGSAQVQLDHSQHHMKRFHVLHGGRSAHLSITAEEPFTYYLILYKAVLMLSPSQKLAQPNDLSRPFHYEYSFVPLYPLPLLETLGKMYTAWMKPDPLNLFHARTLFYQFVHELLWQMQRQGIEPVRPDLLAQMLRYMQECYRDPITLETMSELFDCSVSYLTKLFKKQMNESPIRLLTQIRVKRAADLLEQTETSLQETAELVGYPDAHTLGRSFKKYYGLPPSEFRAKYRQNSLIPKSPVFRTKFAIAPPYTQCYSVNDYESHYHSTRSGGFSVSKINKPYSMAATLLLCMTLLLSACSGATNAGASQSGTNSSPAVQSSSQTPAEASPASSSTASTKTYTDSKGTVTIPANPERIVDLTGSAIGNLLKLDLKPVAALQAALVNPYHEGKLDGIVDLGDGTNLEAILNLDPDLIIVFDFLEESEYEKLAQIAPVVRLKYGAATPSDLLTEFGKITGREQIAQAWIEEWNAKIAEVKPKIAEVVGDKTVSILQPYAKGIYAWGNKGGRGGEILYGDLGLKAPAIIQEALIDGAEFGSSLSLEQLPEYAGDYIFTSNWGWDDGDPDVVYGSSLWKGLPAVKQNQVYFINAQGSYFNDPISLEAQLQFIVESFLGKKA
ncbi:iron complex transport system substrate-binding protein [Paenibacillus algorifonticola]|uniref:Iron complex transport system substrate-binding protein n=1 Tax=Paenibacillus algorifonticola TaxID=684063 RepID=A0A1I2HST7_9BACL|nr:ABC transporter substrate-binding protein [Paenibacillus algorifonticola]SFF31441.1 iron complex transport system substrate-binding protein [Paenibacillus algorifonticola]